MYQHSRHLHYLEGIFEFWMVLAQLSDSMFGGMFWARPVTAHLPGLAQNIPLWVLAKKLQVQ